MNRNLQFLFAFAFVATLLVGVVGAQELGEPSETAITTADCTSAWDESEASKNCVTHLLEAEPAPGANFVNNCAVKALCPATEDGSPTTFSDFHGGPDGVRELLNCNGYLKTDCE
ncbi:MAG: hypothetical protein F4W90_05560 [Gammaproteobacteria bacterium]|nr:hypothetical protein [Gammaproteobacteria bacterium]